MNNIKFLPYLSKIINGRKVHENEEIMKINKFRFNVDKICNKNITESNKLNLNILNS